MKETIFLINKENKLVELSEAKYDSEFLLQQMLSDYPKLLAGSQIDPAEPRRWILISREIGIAGEEGGSNRWSLDHLFIDQDGIPTLVEVKRSTDTRIRREVVGQILDYAANAVAYWKIGDIINEFEQNCEAEGEDSDAVLSDFLDLQAEPEEFWERVDINLKAGKIRMLIVADMIPRELRRIIEFLNEQLSPAEILGVEIKQYIGEGAKTLVPRIVGQTASAESHKSTGKRSEGVIRDEKSYFEEMREYAGEERAKIAREIFNWASPRCDDIWYGKGQPGSGSFVPSTSMPFNGKTRELLPFAVWTRGQMEIYFQYYKNRPPMNKASNKLKLMELLNEIEGVDITEEQLDKRPNFDLLLLKGKGMKKFKAAFEWFYGLFK